MKLPAPNPLHQQTARWAGLILLGLMVAYGVALKNWPPAQTTPIPSCALAAQDAKSPYPGMVWVPPGRFEMGDDRYPEEGPVHATQVAGFWMDRTEVTNDDFSQFVQATGYVTLAERALDPAQYPQLPAFLRQPGAVVFAQPTQLKDRDDLRQWWQFVPGAQWRHPGGPGTDIRGRGAFPVVTMTLADAMAYAQWKGHTLPTEAQWEWAARGGQVLAAKDHDQPHGANTWQGVFPVLNSADDGFVGLAPVACYPPNALGLFDMLGNVWEWTLDTYTPHHRAAAQPDAGPEFQRLAQSVGNQKVIKGGSFLCSPDYCMRYRSGSRQPQEADLGTSHLGFRTVLLAPGPKAAHP